MYKNTIYLAKYVKKNILSVRLQVEIWVEIISYYDFTWQIIWSVSKIGFKVKDETTHQYNKAVQFNL